MSLYSFKHRKKAAASIIVASLILTGSAWGCDDDTIRDVADDGRILVMQSGAVFEVLAGDEIDSALWLPISDVVICSKAISYQARRYVIYEIINTDDHERVSAMRVR